MNERNTILSQWMNRENQSVAVLPKSNLVQFIDFLNEKFDALAALVSKWTNL
jgi:flagellar biosynthesis chaperone FliJ